VLLAGAYSRRTDRLALTNRIRLISLVSVQGSRPAAVIGFLITFHNHKPRPAPARNVVRSTWKHDPDKC
jgi:hypothetical protein